MGESYLSFSSYPFYSNRSIIPFFLLENVMLAGEGKI